MRTLRTIFVLAVAAFFMPSPPEDSASRNGDDPPATEFLAAAVSTVADMRDFCSRQASVCDTAHYLAVKFESKAKYSIRLIYEWANQSTGTAMPQQAYDEDAASTGDLAAASSNNTLRLEDLIPEWRAPKAPSQG